MASRLKEGDKFRALHPNTMQPEWATIESKHGNDICLVFDDGVTMQKTAHHFRRFLKLAENGLFDKPNYTKGE